ncbi:MAG: LacI family DNA-binding transcriptional regulator [Gemmatimonadetes bacterium]|nr:LacI family DNA-binding transcriptional regulator [Gemmatimonadota bacterium]
MATIRDVAREAGVSTATVSRVYNGSRLVTETTTQIVLEAAARLDYWPNNAARSLSTNRTHVLGVVLPDLFDEFFSEIIRGIDHAARARRHQIILSCFHDNADELIATARSMRGRIDGLIAMAPDARSAQAIAEISRHFPVILLNPGFAVENCGSVGIANREGARSVVRHLRSFGHRRIAILRGPVGNTDAEERLRGYREAIGAGETQHQPLELQGDFSKSSGVLACDALLRFDPLPDAVFAANDYMAIGLLTALLEKGIRVPEDIAVAGFDDIALARYTNPPLTTVTADAYRLGATAVRRWFSASADGGSGHQRDILPTRLVVRESCGAGRSGPDTTDTETRHQHESNAGGPS